MFNAIRKNQKKIMAVLGVFLMIAFVADLGIRRYRTQPTNSPMGAYIGDQPLLYSDAQRADLDWKVLQESSQMRFPQFAGMRADGQPEYEYYSLPELQLASRLAPAFGQESPRIARNIVSGLNATNFMLLLKEAQRLNIQPPRDMAEAILTRLQQVPTDNPEAREQAVLDWLTILEAFERIASSIKITPAMGLHQVAQQEERVDIKYVQFEASAFKTQVGEPTKEQIQEFFSKYRNEDPATSPTGFGYRFPNRVKVDYFVVPRAKLREKITDEDVYKFWKENQQLFPTTQPDQPTTQALGPSAPSTQSAAPSTRPTTRPWTEVKDQIRDRLANDLAVQMQNAIVGQMRTDWLAYKEARLAAGNSTQPANIPPSSMGVPFNSQAYLQKLQLHVQGLKQSRGVMPEVVSVDRLLSAKDLAQLDGIGNSYIRIGNQPMFFADFALAMAEPLMTPEQARQLEASRAPVLRLFQPSPPFYGGSNYYIFRLTAADPAHAPATIDGLEQKVTEDWKTAQGYERAKQQATKFLEIANKEGFAAAVKATADWPVKTTGLIYNSPNEFIKDFTLPAQSKAKFVEGAFDLLKTRLKTGKPDPVAQIDLPQAAAVVVAQLVDAKPASEDEYLPARVVTAQQQIESVRSAELAMKWFAPQEIQRRLKYRAERGEKSEGGGPQQPAQAPPPLF